MKNFIYITFILFLYSCGKVQEPSVKALKEVNILTQSDSTLQLAAILVMHNPNSFEIPLTQADYTISIHGKKVGTGKEENLPPLVKEGDTDLKLSPTIQLAAFSELVTTLLTEKETEIVIDGKYIFSVLGQNVPISQSQKTKVNIQELLKKYMSATMQGKGNGMKVENVKIGKADLLQTLVLADLKFTNTLPLDFTIQKMHLDIFPPEKEKQNIKLGEWNLAQSQTLVRGQEVKIPIEIKVSNMALLATMPDILSKKNNQSLFVKGTAEVMMGKNIFNVPIEQNVTL